MRQIRGIILPIEENSIPVTKHSKKDRYAIPNITKPVSYILGEMKTNVTSPAAILLRNLRSNSRHRIHWSDPGHALLPLLRLLIWALLVGPGRTWDHKERILEKFGKWSFDPETRKKFRFDIWSNIHYGYIGASVHFSTALLLGGAGLAQAMGIVWDDPDRLLEALEKSPDGVLRRLLQPSKLDDPPDQTAIRIGIELWYHEGLNVSETGLLELLRRDASRLATRSGAGS
jgi:hypothetical protein